MCWVYDVHRKRGIIPLGKLPVVTSPASAPSEQQELQAVGRSNVQSEVEYLFSEQLHAACPATRPFR